MKEIGFLMAVAAPQGHSNAIADGIRRGMGLGAGAIKMRVNVYAAGKRGQLSCGASSRAYGRDHYGQLQWR